MLDARNWSKHFTCSSSFIPLSIKTEVIFFLDSLKLSLLTATTLPGLAAFQQNLLISNNMLLKSFLVSYCWLITDRWLDVAKCAKKKTLNVVSLAYSMYEWSKTELKVSSYRKGDKI